MTPLQREERMEDKSDMGNLASGWKFTNTSLDAEALQIICTLTYKLIELRQNECRHLCIENTAPELFQGMLRAYFLGVSGESVPTE